MGCNVIQPIKRIFVNTNLYSNVYFIYPSKDYDSTIIIFIPCEFFTLALADGLSLESE